MIHPARYEGFPNVILEAMSAGTAVIAADCHAGPSEIIDNKINGILFPVDDIVSLTESIRTLITNESLRKKYVLKASLKVQSFSKNKVMQKWEKLITE